MNMKALLFAAIGLLLSMSITGYFISRDMHANAASAKAPTTQGVITTTTQPSSADPAQDPNYPSGTPSDPSASDSDQGGYSSDPSASDSDPSGYGGGTGDTSQPDYNTSP